MGTSDIIVDIAAIIFLSVGTAIFVVPPRWVLALLDFDDVVVDIVKIYS